MTPPSPRRAIDMRRRAFLGAAAGLPLLGTACARVEPTCFASDWSGFLARHMQPDGRVVDFDAAGQHSTSEGQSYAMFLALVHNEPDTFERALRWAEQNLCAGQSIDRQLPAWRWGRRGDGSWGVLDPNAASDADLWIAYALLEAARLWSKPQYGTAALGLLNLIAAREVRELPGLGTVLLPWPADAVPPADPPVLRLNPSYLPLQVLRRLALAQPAGPWAAIGSHTVAWLPRVCLEGFAPDWFGYSPVTHAVGPDPEKGPVGSYDAIRVYLWAGMLDPADPWHAPLMDTLAGPARQLRQSGTVFERVDTLTGQGEGHAPVGYAGALLPYLKSRGERALLDTQLARIRTRLDGAATSPLPYYERVLLLFGRDWLAGRYAFAPSGHLQTHWNLKCPDL